MVSSVITSSLSSRHQYCRPYRCDAQQTLCCSHSGAEMLRTSASLLQRELELLHGGALRVAGVIGDAGGGVHCPPLRLQHRLHLLHLRHAASLRPVVLADWQSQRVHLPPAWLVLLHAAPLVMIQFILVTHQGTSERCCVLFFTGFLPGQQQRWAFGSRPHTLECSWRRALSDCRCASPTVSASSTRGSKRSTCGAGRHAEDCILAFDVVFKRAAKIEWAGLAIAVRTSWHAIQIRTLLCSWRTVADTASSSKMRGSIWSTCTEDKHGGP